MSEDPKRGQGPDDRLEACFAAARAARPAPGAALTAAILRDAAAAQHDRAAAVAAAGQSRGAAWRGLWRALGGWPAAAALAGALVLGVILGVAVPDPVDRLAAVWPGAAVDAIETGGAFPGYADLMTEG